MKKLAILTRLLQHAVARYSELISKGDITEASKYLHLINKYNGILSDIEKYGKSDYITL